jgi:hypothetical protein
MATNPPSPPHNVIEAIRTLNEYVGNTNNPAHDNAVIEAMKILNQHIQNDNVIINAKLTQYITVQSLLVVARYYNVWNPWFVITSGLLTSACWFFSMTRTHSYRDRWIKRTYDLVERNPDLLKSTFDLWRPRELPWVGRISSVVTQISIPAIGFLAWLTRVLPK